MCPYVLVCVCTHINFFNATHKLFSHMMMLWLDAEGGFQNCMRISRARASRIALSSTRSPWLKPVPGPGVACLAC